jgi:hypothetical protein
MVELFKFRCYQCQKLIGAPPSRFGTIVKCPKCSVELVVPSPENSTADPEVEPEVDPDAFRPEDLGITLEPEPLRKPATAASAAPSPVGPDPIAFLIQFEEPGETAGAEPPPEPGAPEDSPDLPEPAVEPLVTRPRGRAAIATAGPLFRARDVVLPRTAAVAWALVALFGLAFAFLSGLLLGQRLGK